MPAYITLGADVNRDLTEESRLILAKAGISSGGGGSDDRILPDYVTAPVTATFQRPYFNPESGGLLDLRESIRRARAGEIDFEIVTPGDSKTRRDPANIEWPEQLRRMLGGVDGFVLADTGGTDGRWTASGMTEMTHAFVGLEGAASGAATATFTSTAAFTGLTAFAQGSQAGSFRVLVDGVLAAEVPFTPSTPGWLSADVSGLDDTPHVVRIESDTAAGFRVAGIKLAYPGPRLKISNIARKGSYAAHWAPGGERWETLIAGPTTTPGAVIGALGTNQPTNLDALSTFYNAVAGLNVPSVVISPGGLYTEAGRDKAVVEPMMNRLYQLAQQHDFGLVDFHQIIGTTTDATAHGLMADEIHENTRGLALEAAKVKALLAPS